MRKNDMLKEGALVTIPIRYFDNPQWISDDPY